MNLTVRDESGAWSLLKNAPVLASATATSLEFCTDPKFPAVVAGAFCVRNTPKTNPARSTTATAMSTFTELTAACTIFWTSATCKGCTDATGGATATLLPPPQPTMIITSASAIPKAGKTPSATVLFRRRNACRDSTGFRSECVVSIVRVPLLVPQSFATPQRICRGIARTGEWLCRFAVLTNVSIGQGKVLLTTRRYC